MRSATMNRVREASRREFGVNKRLFLFTNIVLFGGVIIMLLVTNMLGKPKADYYNFAYYFQNFTEFDRGPTYIWSFLVAICGVVAVLSLFKELYSKNNADLIFSLPYSAKERFFSKLAALFKLHILPVIFWNILFVIGILVFGRFTFSYGLKYGVMYALSFIALVMCVDLVVMFCVVCCGTLFETIYTALMIGAVQLILPQLFYYAMIRPFYINYSVRLDEFFSKIPAWSIGAIDFSSYDFSADYILPLCVSIFVSAIGMALTYFLYKRRDGRATGKPIVFKGFFELVMFLGVFSALLLIISNTENIGFVVAILLIYLFVRFISARGAVNVKKLLKWLAAFVGYCAAVLVMSVVSYFNYGFNGMPDMSVIGEYNKAIIVISDNDSQYFFHSKANGEPYTKQQAETILDIYTTAADQRKKSLGDYFKLLKNNYRSDKSADLVLWCGSSPDRLSNTEADGMYSIGFRVDGDDLDEMVAKLKNCDFLEQSDILDDDIGEE